MAAQSDSAAARPKLIQGKLYADAFFEYDANRPPTAFRQPFLYNHNRHRQVNINNLFVKLTASQPGWRANLALHTGTYRVDNYAAEPEALGYIFEANAGFAVSKKRNLWLDAGIFPSHIGFETAISMENPTLTRSLAAENSPYYLAGLKLQYLPAPAWELAVLVTNGWQRIRRVPGSSLPGFGTQVRYLSGSKTTLNWSTFIGTADPDSIRRMRYFSNVYLQYQWNAQWQTTAGWDMGWQQKAKNQPGYHPWLTWVLITRYTWHAQWASALRAEYYADPHGVLINPTYPGDFRTTGFSLNTDFKPAGWLACRLEARYFTNRDAVFESHAGPVSRRFSVVSSVALYLPR